MSAPHDKLAGIKPGDRVRVTCEGRFEANFSHGLHLILDGHAGPHGFMAENVAAPTFQIERIEPPVQVGEMVTWGTKVENWKLVAIEGETGILWNGSYPGNAKLSDLERIA